MSKNQMTTTNGFRVEDITFKKARRQSAIIEELGLEDEIEETEIKAPVSLTPEQVKEFLRVKIEASSDSNEKRLYSQIIMWVDELLKLKRDYVVLQEKIESFNTKEPDVEDIEE